MLLSRVEGSDVCTWCLICLDIRDRDFGQSSDDMEQLPGGDEDKSSPKKRLRQSPGAVDSGMGIDHVVHRMPSAH